MTIGPNLLGHPDYEALPNPPASDEPVILTTPAFSTITNAFSAGAGAIFKTASVLTKPMTSKTHQLYMLTKYPALKWVPVESWTDPRFAFVKKISLGQTLAITLETPKKQMADAIEKAPLLIKDDYTEPEINLILQTLIEISEDQRNDVIEKIKPFIRDHHKAYDIALILQTLGEISEDQRNDVIEKVKPFIKDNHAGYDIASILFVVGKILEDQFNDGIEETRPFALALTLFYLSSLKLTLLINLDLFIENEELKQLLGACDKTLFKIVLNRFPHVLEGKAPFSEIIPCVQLLKSNELLRNMLELNRKLPLERDVLRNITEKAAEFKDNQKPFILALQTHQDYREILSMVPQEKIPSKETFFKLKADKQIEIMKYAQIMRMREALNLANRVIKHADTHEIPLVIQSLKLYRQIGAHASSKSIERLENIITDPKFSVEVRKEAALSLAEIDFDPTSAKRKKLFLEELKKTTDPAFQQALLEAIEKYTFNQSKEDHDIADFLSENKDQWKSVGITLAMTLSVIPHERALKTALEIVNSSIWDSIEEKTSLDENLLVHGGYDTYDYRPDFHDSRKNMRRVIGERYMMMHRNEIQEKIQETYKNFTSNKEPHPNLTHIENRIHRIRFGIRHVPFALFLPNNKMLFRGVNARKGEVLGNAVLDDMLIKGVGSADLSLCQTENGRWAKIGQMFTSTTLDYSLNYFDSKGTLITIKSDYMNEMLLRRNIRIEHEGSIHSVFYERVRHYAITQLFVSNVQKQRFVALEEHAITPAQAEGKLSTIDKIAQRVLQRPEEKGDSLKGKISYFDPNGSLKNQIESLMKEKGLSEATLDEIIRENVERRIAKDLLAENCSDPALRECLLLT